MYCGAAGDKVILGQLRRRREGPVTLRMEGLNSILTRTSFKAPVVRAPARSRRFVNPSFFPSSLPSSSRSASPFSQLRDKNNFVSGRASERASGGAVDVIELSPLLLLLHCTVSSPIDGRVRDAPGWATLAYTPEHRGRGARILTCKLLCI